MIRSPAHDDLMRSEPLADHQSSAPKEAGRAQSALPRKYTHGLAGDQILLERWLHRRRRWLAQIGKYSGDGLFAYAGDGGAVGDAHLASGSRSPSHNILEPSRSISFLKSLGIKPGRLLVLM